MLWGLGVGYVISGMYFGWNLGLPLGGPYGLLAATAIVTVMYIAFVLSYTELSCALPRAGGAFTYAQQAFGSRVGFVTGIAQLIEFTFAPPAIAAAIGAYFHVLFPSIHPLTVSIAAYIIFTGLNIYGVKHSATFELIITIIAVLELLIFIGVTAPSFQLSKFSQDALPNGIIGIFAALPYAIWFYLGIEGIANVAEETRNPAKDIKIGFSSAIATLVLLTILVFFSAVGVAGWQAVVYPPGSSTPSDSPLPLALGFIVSSSSLTYELLNTIGLFGLIASFHGILLIAGRAWFEFGRSGYAPKQLETVLPTRKTPANALITASTIGIIALFTGHTSEMITLAVFGALTLYAISMLALLKLRRQSLDEKRPYKTPWFPYLPMLAFALATTCLISMCIYQTMIAIFYFSFLSISFFYFSVFKKRASIAS